MTDHKAANSSEEREVTGVADEVLLRSLAEDIPDMALSVREHLRHIADRLQNGDLVGQLRCKRCGESNDVIIKNAGRQSSAPAMKFFEAVSERMHQEWGTVDWEELSPETRVDFVKETIDLINSTKSSAPQEAVSADAMAPEYVPGSWTKVYSLDQMEAFYLSRLPAIRGAAREHGYALGVHGSLRRDFDVMAMQWREDCSDPDTLAKAIQFAACGIHTDSVVWEQKPFGRIATSLCICWTDHSEQFKDMLSVGHIDLSILAARSSASHALSTELSEANAKITTLNHEAYTWSKTAESVIAERDKAKARIAELEATGPVVGMYATFEASDLRPWTVCFDSPNDTHRLKSFDTESEALQFIENCKGKQKIVASVVKTNAGTFWSLMDDNALPLGEHLLTIATNPAEGE